ncbi:MAG: site-2 protease family protein [Candidatus Altiarchaeota archaeon]|nr:site-2 protease family protein [Candidatus Altiarchaeota archaeon]
MIRTRGDEKNEKMFFDFSRRELGEMAVSVVVLSLVFSDYTVESVIYSFIAVGFGFVFHELGHRFVARRYGLHAEYRMWVNGLVFALFLSVASGGGFVFAAPGAVYISGIISRDKHGKIALAGPIVNVFLAVTSIIFLVSLVIVGVSLIPDSVFNILYMISIINLFLAAFNMLPFPPLDGASVIAWNKWVWAIIEVPLVIVMFFLMLL